MAKAKKAKSKAKGAAKAPDSAEHAGDAVVDETVLAADAETTNDVTAAAAAVESDTSATPGDAESQASDAEVWADPAHTTDGGEVAVGEAWAPNEADAATWARGEATAGDETTDGVAVGDDSAISDDIAAGDDTTGRVLPFEQVSAASEETVDEVDPNAPPPLTDARLVSVIESLLFASDRAQSMSDLKRLTGEKDGKRIAMALEALEERQTDSGLIVVSAAGGWQLRTSPKNAAWVGQLVVGKPVRLSRAMLETLAIVSYRQPITRPEIDDIRGVDCGPVLKTLLDRALVRVIGKKEEVGRPLLYGTTPEFLRTFNLRDLTELPTLREFHELGAEEEAKVREKHGLPAAVATDSGAPAASTEGDAPAPMSSVFSPTAPIADRPEDESLLDELDRAAEAAARALGDAEAEPARPPSS